jgi:uncharacterized 2Fe-2S/4Fe-4S cluster protein (DUF4445 family)
MKSVESESVTVRIGIEPQGKWLEMQGGESLREALFQAGIEFPCGGKGRCGGCRVQLLEGELEPSQVEREYFTDEEIVAGWRFACRATPKSDIRLHIQQWEMPILTSHAAIDLNKAEGYGIAVDLGTTTIVAQLVDLMNGQVLCVARCLNPQAAYGADVMNRIDYATAGKGFDALVSSLRIRIGALVEELNLSSGINNAELKRIVIAGNTLMHHFFCGLDVTPLSKAPFDSPNGGMYRLSASELNWPNIGTPQILVLPCLGGFVGGDIVAGILATQLHRREGFGVLIDLGTNGEIVVGNHDRLLCTSTSVGPAFEGGRIKMGMQATLGAIDSVQLDENGLRVHVIGNKPAKGLCGSGLVDAVACGLELGLLNESGRIVHAERIIRLSPSVYLNQTDIRQLQLAKGAIAAGIDLLIAELGITKDAIDTVFLAGAFGNYVNVASAFRIGLLEFDERQISPVGNTALSGAKLALGFANLDEELSEILEKTRHISLGTNPGFQEKFIAATRFPDTRGSQLDWPD